MASFIETVLRSPDRFIFNLSRQSHVGYGGGRHTSAQARGRPDGLHRHPPASAAYCGAGIQQCRSEDVPVPGPAREPPPACLRYPRVDRAADLYRRGHPGQDPGAVATSARSDARDGTRHRDRTPLPRPAGASTEHAAVPSRHQLRLGADVAAVAGLAATDRSSAADQEW